MRVLITGAAGRLGRVLLPQLLADPRIKTVIAHDQHAIPLRHARLHIYQGDIRDPNLIPVIHTADAVVHMAFVVIESGLGVNRANRSLTHAININGTHHVLNACRPQTRLIHLSSASVYGSSHSALTETAPLKPLTGFAYAEDKAHVERMLDQATDHSLSILRLRPHIILGPQAQPFLRGILRLPFYPYAASSLPLLQVVHEYDVATAIQQALFTPLTGSLNLATEDAVSFADIQRLLHWWPIPIPASLMRWAARAAFEKLSIGPDPAWTNGLNQSLILNCNRAREELGWRPRYPRVADVLNGLAQPQH